MVGRDHLVIDFTDEADWVEHRGGGWSFAETGGAWTEGHASDLLVPEPPDAPCHTLLLRVAPFLGGGVAMQRLVVRVDGTQVGAFDVGGPQTVSCEVPEAVLRRDGAMRIAFEQPDAMRPADVGGSEDRRLLGFMHERLVMRRSTVPQGAPPVPSAATAALLGRFESLGDTCEFSFLQRRHGVEPVGLFRFAGIRLHRLLEGLDDDFAGLRDPEMLTVMSAGSEGSRDIYHRRYGYMYHTVQPEEALRTADFRRREAARLGFLWRILKGDLRAAARIFVVRSVDDVSERHLRLLLARLRRFGNVTLLWVVEAGHAAQVGQVIHLGDRLLKGHVAYLTTSRAYDLDETGWLQVCAEAERMAARLEPVSGAVPA
ncbi:MAG: hypothetical protein ACRYGC_13520 [Janthinobacterium lividum]